MYQDSEAVRICADLERRLVRPRPDEPVEVAPEVPELAALSCAGWTQGRRCSGDVAFVSASIPLCDVHVAQVGADLQTYQSRLVSMVVYYLGDPVSQKIKIGTTRNLVSRISTHRSQFPGALLLATEPGDIEQERRRHREFRQLRVPPGREWFRRVPVLMEHVGAIRKKWGILSTGGVLSSWYIAGGNDE